MLLCEELKKLKNASRMTAKQIAEASNVPESTVNRILSGETECPSFQAVADIVVAMHGSLDDIVGITRQTSAPMDDEYKHRLLSDLNIKDKWIKALFLILSSILVIFLFSVVYHSFT